MSTKPKADKGQVINQAIDILCDEGYDLRRIDKWRPNLDQASSVLTEKRNEILNLVEESKDPVFLKGTDLQAANWLWGHGKIGRDEEGAFFSLPKKRTSL